MPEPKDIKPLGPKDAANYAALRMKSGKEPSTKRLGKGNSVTLGTYDKEGNLVASAEAEIKNETAYAHDLYVDESHRRQGLGRRLINAIFGIAKEKGAKSIETEIEVGNVDSIKIHQTDGYEIVEQKTAKNGQKYYKMRKLL